MLQVPAFPAFLAPYSLPSSLSPFVVFFPHNDVAEDEHLDVVPSSASVCLVPLKPLTLSVPACHPGRQQAWQICFADKTHLTSAM